MRTRHLFIACLLFPALLASAQTGNDVEQKKKEINSVKKSSQYIYAEATAATEQEAKDMAEEMLYQNINEWVATRKKLRQSSDIIISGKKELWSTIELTRGNMYRSFMYVKKSNIQPGGNAEVVENPNPVKEEKPAAKRMGRLESAVQPIDATAATYPEVVRRIAACEAYADMVEMVKQYEREGKIGSYARYAQLTKPDIYYLVIYNKAGKVVAVLTPGETRVNVKTNAEDKIANYAGCGAIGFTVKQ